jgi:hypothetical protein
MNQTAEVTHEIHRIPNFDGIENNTIKIYGFEIVKKRVLFSED